MINLAVNARDAMVQGGTLEISSANISRAASGNLGHDLIKRDEYVMVEIRDTGKGKILLVEDEEAVRMFAARALHNKGYTVLEADCGEAALECFNDQNGDIDLLVSDVVMPQMDGPTLVREVRAQRPDLKVIFISGYAEDAFRRNLDPDSDFELLSKPFSLKQLTGRVKDVIGG